MKLGRVLGAQTGGSCSGGGGGSQFHCWAQGKRETRGKKLTGHPFSFTWEKRTRTIRKKGGFPEKKEILKKDSFKKKTGFTRVLLEQTAWSRRGKGPRVHYPPVPGLKAWTWFGGENAGNVLGGGDSGVL